MDPVILECDNHCFELTDKHLITERFDRSRFRPDGLEQTAVDILMIVLCGKEYLIRET